MRYIALLLPLALFAAPISAQAGPQDKAAKTLEQVLSKTSGSDGLNLKDSLPSAKDIDAIIDELPDFNHLMDGLIEIAKDEKIRSQIADSAAHMKEKFEQSGALEPRENGLPDINAGLAIMLRSLSDEDGLGGILDALESVNGELETVMEESLEKKGTSSAG
jgi:hypothetical protein